MRSFCWWKRPEGRAPAAGLAFEVAQVGNSRLAQTPLWNWVGTRRTWRASQTARTSCGDNAWAAGTRLGQSRDAVGGDMDRRRASDIGARVLSDRQDGSPFLRADPPIGRCRCGDASAHEMFQIAAPSSSLSQSSNSVAAMPPSLPHHCGARRLCSRAICHAIAPRTRPSSSGLGRRPFTAKTGVRFPLGAPLISQARLTDRPLRGYGYSDLRARNRA